VDDLARREEEFISQRGEPPELIEERRKALLALLKIRQSFLASAKIVAGLLPFLLFGLILVWLWHLAAPPQWRWLSADEIGHLQSLIFSGAVSALATAIATKAI
jgi:hypothetical protein